MPIKEELKEFLKGKDKVPLSEIYANVGAGKPNIRAILNLSVKNKGDFERVGKGEYKLKEK